MRLTVLCMLSTASLSAFSHAATARVDRSGPVQAVRDRAPTQVQAPAPAMQPPKPDVSGPAPRGSLPRGSLVDLSV